jgi:hypothetical protein
VTAVITTLFEAGDYEEGVAALLNSLVTSGFKGRVWCGVRGLGTSRLASRIADQKLDGRVEVKFLEIETHHHLRDYKPHFMLEAATREPDAECLVYFDPDIVVKCRWEFVEAWCSEGIAAIGDEKWQMPASSPIRAQWLEQRYRLDVQSYSTEAPGELDMYCNSGFVGIPSSKKEFLELWADLTDKVLNGGPAEVQRLIGRNGAEPVDVRDDRAEPVNTFDQDLFNIALMGFGRYTKLMGSEAMDFASGGRIFSHATGAPKPWARKYIRLALQGYPPSKRDGQVLRHARGSISLVSTLTHRRRLAAYRLARLMGSFVRRTDF